LKVNQTISFCKILSFLTFACKKTNLGSVLLNVSHQAKTKVWSFIDSKSWEKVVTVQFL